ncbi:MAG: tetratricopeptide repeat protein [Treponema sp.]|nr:tetratricopeptide repeat protein [Treponema sp.]
MKTRVEELIEQAYERLKVTDAVSALRLLEEALKIDFDHPEVKYGLKCVNWWLDRLKKLDDLREPYEKGGYVISQWKTFHVFLDQIGNTAGGEESCIYAVRNFVFRLALKYLEDVLANSGNSPDPEILLQMGRCYKGIGNYEEAARFLEQAVHFKPDDSGALAELADVRALLGDPRAAKVLFREAFYLDPQAIDLWFMESEMIIRLKEKVAELGYTGKEIAEWIPVYGTLWGIFSVQRELKPVELGKLKQAILALESESNNKPGEFSKPRLLNRYFRLIDHYGARARTPGDNSDVVEETMRKIKFIDSAVYEQYRN